MDDGASSTLTTQFGTITAHWKFGEPPRCARQVQLRSWTGSDCVFEEAFNDVMEHRTEGGRVAVWTQFHLVEVSASGSIDHVWQAYWPFRDVLPFGSGWITIEELGIGFFSESGFVRDEVHEVVTAWTLEKPRLTVDLWDGSSHSYVISEAPIAIDLVD